MLKAGGPKRWEKVLLQAEAIEMRFLEVCGAVSSPKTCKLMKELM